MDATKLLGIVIIASVVAAIWFTVTEPIPKAAAPTNKKRKRKQPTPQKKKKS